MDGNFKIKMDGNFKIKEALENGEISLSELATKVGNDNEFVKKLQARLELEIYSELMETFEAPGAFKFRVRVRKSSDAASYLVSLMTPEQPACLAAAANAR